MEYDPQNIQGLTLVQGPPNAELKPNDFAVYLQIIIFSNDHSNPFIEQTRKSK